MSTTPDTKKEATKDEDKKVKSESEKKQQQSDPNITELKGLTDPSEDLEVKGTDNPF